MSEPSDQDEPLDLDELERVATWPGPIATVERSWLIRALQELREGRAAIAELATMRERAGACFGLKPEQRL